jgi:hypothetical protein
MGKTGGAGDNLYLGGYDISGDIGSLSKVGGGPALLDVTGIDKSAHERIGALFSGEISFNAWFNAASAQEHAVLSALPTTDVDILYARGTALGSPAAFGRFKPINYDMTRAQGGALSEAVQALSNAYPLFWGVQLTTGKQSFTGAGNQTGVDLGANPNAPAVTITSASAANPTSVLTATPHGLVSGDSVTISGSNKAALNSDWQVTVVDSTHFTVPCDLSGGASTGASMQQTSADFGLTAMLQNFNITGTSDTPKLQHSADNGVVDAYADITGGGFTAISTAPTTQLIQTTTTRTIRRWVRPVTVGTFNPNGLAIAAMRHLTSTI